jgi:type VII secretion effector (TIGR04197 family)
MTDQEKIKILTEKLDELKIEFDSATQIKKSEVMLNSSFQDTIKKQEIVINQLRKVIDDLLNYIIKLKNKIEKLD